MVPGALSFERAPARSVHPVLEFSSTSESGQLSRLAGELAALWSSFDVSSFDASSFHLRPFRSAFSHTAAHETRDPFDPSTLPESPALD